MWKNTDLTCLDELTGNSLWGAISKQIDEVKDGAVYVALREKGRKSIEKWYKDVSWEVAIIDIIDSFYRRSNHNDTIEICLTYDYENLEELPPEDARGVLGIKCYSDDPYKTMSLAPTTMIAQNSNFEWFQRTFQKQFKIGEEENVYMDSFKAHQFIILTGEKNYLAKTYRGCQVVSDDKVNYNDTKQFAFDMSEWIQRSISQNEGEEGKMLYLYWPSTYITDRSYNLLRVLTVPYILLRSSEYFQDQIFYQAATLCLRQQVGKYYNEAKNFGYVSGGRYADIGQAAFLGMSLLEHGGSEFEKVEENILKFTLAQYRENGSFETNYFPTNKKDDYLFYPGETLIYWSMRLKKFYDEELLEKALKAVEFYKNWFESQEEKKPYFVSWQSVAISNLYDITKEKWLYEYAAELNDWLLEFQQIDDAPFEDLSGRFYDKRWRRRFEHSMLNRRVLIRNRQRNEKCCGNWRFRKS